jgi:hypothetical protein
MYDLSPDKLLWFQVAGTLTFTIEHDTVCAIYRASKDVKLRETFDVKSPQVRIYAYEG